MSYLQSLEEAEAKRYRIRRELDALVEDGIIEDVVYENIYSNPRDYHGLTLRVIETLRKFAPLT